jgi:putative DNA primase/helicase
MTPMDINPPYTSTSQPRIPLGDLGAERTKTALWYPKNLRWPVFPVHGIRDGCCTCGNLDCDNTGKHPRTAHGVKDATCDAEQIKRWWKKWPDANIGLATGAPSGVDVLDVDPRHGGDDSLRDLELEHGEIGPTVISVTGGGGSQLFFRHEPGLKCSTGTIAAGLDFKTTGGYVILPRSTHKNGRFYEWEGASRPDELEVAAHPEWLLAKIRSASSRPNGKAPSPLVEEKIRAGQRNAKLASLAGSLRYKGFNTNEIAVLLAEVNTGRCNPPLPTQEVRKIAESVGRYPAAVPIAHSSAYLWNDTGNADRLADAQGKDLIYCPERKAYYVHTGRHWEYDDFRYVEKLAEQTMRAAYAEAGQMEKGKRDEFLRFLNKSLSRNSLSNMVHLAKKKVPALSPTAFDTDPWALNCLNVTVDLRTGEGRLHRREDLNAKLIPLTYNAGAQCPIFLRSLYRIMGDGPDASDEERDRAGRMVEYLQKLFGCAATGKPEKLLVVFYGKSGNNGKTTLLETIGRALGDGSYATLIKIESLMTDPRGTSNATTSDLSDLLSARFARTGEVDKGQRLSLARVKDLTGLGTMKTRRMREDWITFKPTHKPFIDANERPEISNPTDPVWNRVICVPFEVELSPDEIDTELPEKLEAELPGILAWIVAGAQRYYKDGLRGDCPPEVLAATAEYQAHCDRLKDFIEDCCDLNRLAWVSSKHLMKAYSDWCSTNGEKQFQGNELTDLFRGKGCSPQSKKVLGTITRGWNGIQLKKQRLPEQ